jgi:asparagine synthase (glutamine-hydrolysing)
LCGICGEWNSSGVERETLARMNAALVHRGPDDEGQVVLGEAGLAMRRLAIIDLATGHQPIANEEGTIWIVGNGEIYNHRELRRGLAPRGHRFATESDVEVILHLYEERGERVVDELRGMFAFALWDTRRRKLLLARDRFGQKPVFYRFDGRRLLFGSEIKAILAALPSPPDLDPRALDEYLTLRFIPSPRTLFSGISKVPPAHLLVLDASGVEPHHPEAPRGTALRAAPRIELRRYWKLAYLPKRTASEDDLVAETRCCIQDAVASHLMSDVPLGAFLSGGMDSSLVVAMMAEIAASTSSPTPARWPSTAGPSITRRRCGPTWSTSCPAWSITWTSRPTPSPPACTTRRRSPPGTSRWF